MIFKTFDDKLLLLLHSPNKHPLERPAYFELEDKKRNVVCEIGEK